MSEFFDGSSGIVNGGANPTAQVGLTAVNGSATTFLRSDAAPPVDQTIAPTWSGKHTFSAINPAIGIESDAPNLRLRRTTAGLNAQIWDFYRDGSTNFTIRTRTDVDGAGTDAQIFARSGATVTRVTFPTDAAALNFVVGPVPGTTIQNARATFTTAVAATHAAQFTNAGNTGYVIGILNPVAASDSGFIGFYTNTSVEKGSIGYSVGTNLTLFTTTSDERLKENIRDCGEVGHLIDSLRVRSFDWKDSNASLDYWMVAQEVYTVAPFAVHKPSNDDLWSLDVTKLVPMLIKELQDLRGRVALLEHQLTGKQ